jgi:hypothetical protein
MLFGWTKTVFVTRRAENISRNVGYLLALTWAGSNAGPINERRTMRITIVTAAVLVAASAQFALAQTGPAEKKDSGSLSSGAKDAMPATGGSTAMPNAEPKSGSISDKAKEATDGGTNAATNPDAKPMTSDIPAAAKKSTD